MSRLLLKFKMEEVIMKKLLRNGSAIMLLLSVSVGLSACGSKETSAPPATTQAKTEISEEISEEVYEEETTTEAVETEETTTEAVEEVEYNPLTTFVYGDTKVDFLTMTMEQWIKLLQQMKIVVDRDDVDMSIELAPYEEYDNGCPLFAYTCYNPTGEEIYLKDAKFLLLEIRPDNSLNQNIAELGIFDGKAKIGYAVRELNIVRKELFNGSLSTDRKFVLDDGRNLHIRMRDVFKPEKAEDGSNIVNEDEPLEYIRFEIDPFYE